jgi:hypothetical protein
MGLLKTLLSTTSLALSFSVPTLSVPTGAFHDQVQVWEPPKWNFANETTADATADGSVGVIIEPDLVYVEGKTNTGKDGATVKKIKFGPYTLQPGQKKEFPIGAYGITPIERGRELPCTECYITAMQLNLEYPDGKIANVVSI